MEFTKAEMPGKGKILSTYIPVAIISQKEWHGHLRSAVASLSPVARPARYTPTSPAVGV